ncbi:MAG: hypothetical protein ACT4OK_10035 [Gemmobacter sp.]
MKLPSRLAAIAGALALLPVPALATPVAGFATTFPMADQRPSLPLLAECDEEPEDDRGEYEEDGQDGDTGGEFPSEGVGLIPGYTLDSDAQVIPVNCDGGANFDRPGPGTTDIIVSSIEAGIAHCGQYTEVWRIDCISDELERMARKMPRANEYRRARAEVLAAAERLRALAAQNANPAQPPVRRAAKVGNVRRTTTRPIVAVAPNRVAATNLAAEAVVSELATTLLRSAGNSASTSRELTRVAQAVDSTKVLLRST